MKTKYLYSIILGIKLSFITILSAQETIFLYPEGKMPNSKGIKVEDSLSNERYYKIGRPRITAWLTSKDENKGTAVLIIPGGGYNHITHNMSGIQLAKWFNTLGINAFVLYFRLPHSTDLINKSIGPLQDAQRAMRFIRANEKNWNINPESIGVMGTSAGGHLSSTLATHLEDVSDVKDSLTNYSFRPDFMILISPVISMNEFTHKGSRDKLLGENPNEQLIKLFSNEYNVTEKTPPTFIAHANDDNVVSPMNSILFYQALLKNNISASLHIFPHGGHKIAMRNNLGSTKLWTELCEEWLIEMGFLNEFK
jgi:acetyl esterase/lipase